MIIQVTQQHIDFGLRGSCSSDPLSLAMLDAGLSEPWVSPAYFRWKKDGKTYFHPIPENVVEFIIDFDNGKEVRPFEFEVEA